MLSKNTRNIVATLLLGSLAAQACGSQVVSPRVDIRAPSKMVDGYPMPIELRVLGQKEVMDSSMLRDVSMFTYIMKSDQHIYTYLRNIHITGKRVPDPFPDPGGHAGTMSVPAPRINVPANTTGQFILDLTHLKKIDSVTHEPFENVEPGTYTLKLFARANPQLHGSQPTVEIQEPNIFEQRLIDRLDALESNRPKWETFILHAPELLEGIPIALLSDAGRRQIGYHLLLADLVHDPREIFQLTIEDNAFVQNLWSGYQTSVLILRYEIALAAGNQDQIDLLKEIIQQINPTALKSFRQYNMYGWPIGRLRRLKLKQEEELSQPE